MDPIVSNTATAETAFKIIGANQARYDIASGIELKGYVVTNRILRTILTYDGFNLDTA